MHLYYFFKPFSVCILYILLSSLGNEPLKQIQEVRPASRKLRGPNSLINSLPQVHNPGGRFSSNSQLTVYRKVASRSTSQLVTCLGY